MSQRLTIVIETGNAAFGEEDGHTHLEVARILHAMAERIEAHGIPPAPKDSNGNVCGSVTVEEV